MYWPSQDPDVLMSSYVKPTLKGKRPSFSLPSCQKSCIPHILSLLTLFFSLLFLSFHLFPFYFLCHPHWIKTSCEVHLQVSLTWGSSSHWLPPTCLHCKSLSATMGPLASTCQSFSLSPYHNISASWLSSPSHLCFCLLAVWEMLRTYTFQHHCFSKWRITINLHSTGKRLPPFGHFPGVKICLSQ